jgi:hypothetical protein
MRAFTYGEMMNMKIINDDRKEPYLNTFGTMSSKYQYIKHEVCSNI